MNPHILEIFAVVLLIF